MRDEEKVNKHVDVFASKIYRQKKERLNPFDIQREKKQGNYDIDMNDIFLSSLIDILKLITYIYVKQLLDFCSIISICWSSINMRWNNHNILIRNKHQLNYVLWNLRHEI